jgi:hypothetical protein
MKQVARDSGRRRFDLPVEFPLQDDQGNTVLKDRRQLSDRRKSRYNVDDLKVILKKMSGNRAV